MAMSAAATNRSIAIVLSSLVECFGSLDLEVNWSKGKTEALRVRASGALEKWRRGSELSILVLQTEQRLSI
eukprot:10296971-Heterocapsa_arctica.AAC.1